MSEFLLKGFNVAIPEVDIGDDIFVVEDQNNSLFRIQVKSAKMNTQKQNAQFSIPLNQLIDLKPILIHYIFAVYSSTNWKELIVIKQDDLLDLLKKRSSTQNSKNINISINYKNNKAFWGKIDLTPFINNFDDFPIQNIY